MKKLIRYLNNDMVDLCLLILFVILLVKSLVEHFNPYIQAGIIFACIYILGVMWRMGGAKDLMNEYITESGFRSLIGLPPWHARHLPAKGKTTTELIFKYIFLISWTTVLIITLWLR